MAHNNLGVALKDEGKRDEAIAEYKIAVRLQPNLVLAHNNLGIALNDQGKRDEAIAAYREVIRLKPDDGPAHNNLAWSLVVTPGRPPRDYDEGLAHAREAVGLGKPSSARYGTLALAEYRSGHWAEFLAASERAMALSKGISGYGEFCQALAHSRNGDKNEAGKWFDKAVDWTRRHAADDRELLGLWSEAADLLNRPRPDSPVPRGVERPH
jgi:superkiller protein 3